MKSIVLVSVALLGLVSSASPPFELFKHEITQNFNKFNFANADSLSDSVKDMFGKLVVNARIFADTNGKKVEDYSKEFWDTISGVKATMLKKAEEPGLPNDKITAAQKKKAIQEMFVDIEKNLKEAIPDTRHS